MGQDFWTTASLNEVRVEPQPEPQPRPRGIRSALHVTIQGTTSLYWINPLIIPPPLTSPDPPSQDLSKRFPFNQDLDMEQSSRSPDKEKATFKDLIATPLSPLIETPPDPPITPKKDHRRTMSAESPNPTPTTPRRFGSLTHSPRLRDLARRARSPEMMPAPPSPSKRSAPVTPVGPRFWSVKTSAPNSPNPRWMLPSPRKNPESPTTTVQTVEVPESPTPSPRLPRVSFSFNVNAGTPKKPLVEFRGGASWLSLPRDKSKLGLDLFAPFAQGQEDTNCLDLIELKPLCQFRGLRSLKLVGMLQSYQTYIWQTAWLNLGLDELELGMVLGPEIMSVTHGRQWKLVEEGWTMDEKQSAEPVY